MNAQLFPGVADEEFLAAAEIEAPQPERNPTERPDADLAAKMFD